MPLKGIAIPHRAITRLVLNTNYITIHPGDRVAHASNCSFDAATFEIWGALLNGAQLIIVPGDITLSFEEYAHFIQQQRIDIIFLTTALFNQLAQHTPWAFHTVRALLFGGEAVTARWAHEVLQHGAPTRLLHVYGPTESTTYASWHLVEHVPQDASTIPIGRPISNTQIYLLNERLHPVPIGVAGELYIGGEGLARGYVNQPAMTADKFIPDPFSVTPGSRLYKTGDLARFRDDGSIEFLGRIDHQIKLRGFRIELGEIQVNLETFPGVREAAVLLRRDHPGGSQLVAYVVPDTDAALPSHALRDFLRERLPEYMIPAAFVTLETLPLNPNGKIDRNALPMPIDDSSDDLNRFVAPQTHYEKLLASIWQEVLHRDYVSVNDNFFDLGGHSLLLARAHNRLCERVNHTIPMVDLFQYPTISSLAQHLDRLLAPTEPEADSGEIQEHIEERVARQKRALKQRSKRMRNRRSFGEGQQ
jgi:acyl-coenzyme A synthetase/AMP-(fatty) acid ligase